MILIALGEDPDLPACVEALAEAAPARTQLILVQNRVEGSAPWDLAIPPDPWIRRPENPGFTGAFRDGYARCRSPWILSLTPDAHLGPQSLSHALEALKGHPRAGGVAFRLERPGGALLDSAGIRLGFLRRGKDRGAGEAGAGRYEEAAWVDAACMACALFRRTALEAARDGAGDILDQRFFVYKEDVDLGWRLRRSGHPLRYEPAATATHGRGWKPGLAARRERGVELRRMSLRNRLWTLLKNESALGLVLKSPFFLLHELAVAGFLCLREPGVLPAYAEVLMGAAECRARRRLASGSGPAPR